MLHTLAAAGSVINLNQPGSYWKWSIFNISVANLALIGVMVLIFGLALIVPFPHRDRTLPPLPAEPERLPEPPADGADADDARMWTARVRRGALRLLPPGKLLPDRQPAYVASWIYVFGVASLVTLGMAIVTGFAHRARRSRLVALQPGWPLLQQHAPVERRAVHGVHGHPLVGQVLDGRLARPPDHDLDHRRGRVPGVDRRMLHRLPVAAELRLAVDLHQRQGRVQRRGRRRVLQRDELRPDAHVAHRAAPDRAHRHRRRARAAGPHPRRQPPAAEPRPLRRPRCPQGCRDGRRGTVARPHPALRHPQGRHHRERARPRARAAAGRAPVLARCAVGHRPVVVQGRARGLPRDRRQRAERHQRDRHLRTALQQRVRQLAEAAVRRRSTWQASCSRSTRPTRTC